MNQNLRQDRLDSDLMANHFLQHNGADFTNNSFLIQPGKIYISLLRLM